MITVTPTRPGTYSIICNEYCGVNHHTMASRLYVKGREKSNMPVNRMFRTDPATGLVFHEPPTS